ncbi:MAG TPA: GNAT family N-acetyltransferase [Candidatus Limnocylindrales bacterium]|nr:GNAT family N-acetyltransferase [Candidatus Limnocylindrales bacterium]
MNAAPDVLTDDVVTLRPAGEQDLDAIRAGIEDPDVVRWIGPPHGTAAETLALDERRAAAGSPTFCVCEREDRCLGLAWLNRDDDDASSASIGYFLLPVARGRGLATRAVRLLAAWARGPGGVRHLRLVTAVDNAASRAVAERSGFRESERRWRTDADGRTEEHVVHVPDHDPSA